MLKDGVRYDDSLRFARARSDDKSLFGVKVRALDAEPFLVVSRHFAALNIHVAVDGNECISLYWKGILHFV